MKRGLLLLVPAMALGLAGHALAQGPSGVINAEPNPCRIKPGEKECTSHITWEVQGARHAKVVVKSESKEGEKVHEFSGSLSCRGHECPAPWIRPDTRYVFRLLDGEGRELSLVTVTAIKEER
ncbi:MAG TPA: hypothetical protein VK335_17850 [Bryobacteraceae bacterium]|nr:hypothetical protein [Bryobacteraceae bacterium]